MPESSRDIADRAILLADPPTDAMGSIRNIVESAHKWGGDGHVPIFRKIRQVLMTKHPEVIAKAFGGDPDKAAGWVKARWYQLKGRKVPGPNSVQASYEESYTDELMLAMWEGNRHPRWPKGTPAGQGGEFMRMDNLLHVLNRLPSASMDVSFLAEGSPTIQHIQATRSRAGISPITARDVREGDVIWPADATKPSTVRESTLMDGPGGGVVNRVKFVSGEMRDLDVGAHVTRLDGQAVTFRVQGRGYKDESFTLSQRDPFSKALARITMIDASWEQQRADGVSPLGAGTGYVPNLPAEGMRWNGPDAPRSLPFNKPPPGVDGAFVLVRDGEELRFRSQAEAKKVMAVSGGNLYRDSGPKRLFVAGAVGNIERRFPVGSVVRHNDTAYVVDGYWRGYLAVHNPENDTHVKLPPNDVTVSGLAKFAPPSISGLLRHDTPESDRNDSAAVIGKHAIYHGEDIGIVIGRTPRGGYRVAAGNSEIIIDTPEDRRALVLVDGATSLRDQLRARAFAASREQEVEHGAT